MTKEQNNKEIQKQFIERAKQENIQVFKNNIRSAKPLSQVCGVIKTKYPSSLSDLVCGR